jgi:hypothetical protein
LKIGDESLIDVLEGREGAYSGISLTQALKGVVTWTEGLERNGGNGSVFSSSWDADLCILP